MKIYFSWYIYQDLADDDLFYVMIWLEIMILTFILDPCNYFGTTGFIQ